MSLFGNSSNVYFNGSSVTKAYLNGNVVWTLPTASNDLILYFDPSDVLSYSGTGNTINDLSNNGLNGVMSNISFTSPYFTYNGSTSQVSVADNSLLEPESGEFTIEVWFYRTSIVGTSVLLGKFNDGGSSTDVSYSIRISNNSLFAQIGDGTGGVLNVDYVNSTSYTFSANTWYHVVYVWKPGVSLETFINGTSIGTISTTMSSILNSTNPLYLGRYNGGEYAQDFEGRMGIVRLYNTALTSSDVLDNYNNDILKYTGPIQLLTNPDFDSGTIGWSASGGFGTWSFTSSNQVAVKDGVLYFTYVNRTVSQSVNVSSYISSANSFNGIINIKREENGSNNNDTYNFTLLFKNSSGGTVVTKTTGSSIAPLNYNDITLTLNRSEIPSTFDTITTVEVQLTGLDVGYWNGNHGPWVEYIKLNVS
jgi:Concanavalin A-like lectin/glucanases superfamily